MSRKKIKTPVREKFASNRKPKSYAKTPSIKRRLSIFGFSTPEPECDPEFEAEEPSKKTYSINKIINGASSLHSLVTRSLHEAKQYIPAPIQISHIDRNGGATMVYPRVPQPKSPKSPNVQKTKNADTNTVKNKRYTHRKERSQATVPQGQVALRAGRPRPDNPPNSRTRATPQRQRQIGFGAVNRSPAPAFSPLNQNSGAIQRALRRKNPAPGGRIRADGQPPLRSPSNNPVDGLLSQFLNIPGTIQPQLNVPGRPPTAPAFPPLQQHHPQNHLLITREVRGPAESGHTTFNIVIVGLVVIVLPFFLFYARRKRTNMRLPTIQRLSIDDVKAIDEEKKRNDELSIYLEPQSNLIRKPLRPLSVFGPPNRESVPFDGRPYEVRKSKQQQEREFMHDSKPDSWAQSDWNRFTNIPTLMGWCPAVNPRACGQKAEWDINKMLDDVEKEIKKTLKNICQQKKYWNGFKRIKLDTRGSFRKWWDGMLATMPNKLIIFGWYLPTWEPGTLHWRLLGRLVGPKKTIGHDWLPLPLGFGGPSIWQSFVDRFHPAFANSSQTLKETSHLWASAVWVVGWLYWFCIPSWKWHASYVFESWRFEDPWVNNMLALVLYFLHWQIAIEFPLYRLYSLLRYILPRYILYWMFHWTLAFRRHYNDNQSTGDKSHAHRVVYATNHLIRDTGAWLDRQVIENFRVLAWWNYQNSTIMSWLYDIRNFIFGWRRISCQLIVDVWLWYTHGRHHGVRLHSVRQSNRTDTSPWRAIKAVMNLVIMILAFVFQIPIVLVLVVYNKGYLVLMFNNLLFGEETPDRGTTQDEIQRDTVTGVCQPSGWGKGESNLAANFWKSMTGTGPSATGETFDCEITRNASSVLEELQAGSSVSGRTAFTKSRAPSPRGKPHLQSSITVSISQGKPQASQSTTTSRTKPQPSKGNAKLPVHQEILQKPPHGASRSQQQDRLEPPQTSTPTYELENHEYAQTGGQKPTQALNQENETSSTQPSIQSRNSAIVQNTKEVREALQMENLRPKGGDLLSQPQTPGAASEGAARPGKESVAGDASPSSRKPIHDMLEKYQKFATKNSPQRQGGRGLIPHAPTGLGPSGFKPKDMELSMRKADSTSSTDSKNRVPTLRSDFPVKGLEELSALEPKPAKSMKHVPKDDIESARREANEFSEPLKDVAGGSESTQAERVRSPKPLASESNSGFPMLDGFVAEGPDEITIYGRPREPVASPSSEVKGTDKTPASEVSGENLEICSNRSNENEGVK